MGARGNSGVILSQIARGAVDVLAEAEEIDANVIAGALRSASDAAYRAVRKPVEGTMLSVIRELAEEAEAQPGVTPTELLKALVRRGEEAVARTPMELEILREAGVVDAGGAGVLEIVRGLTAIAAGEPLPESAESHELPVEAVHQELSRYRYCTVFVVEGEGLDPERLENELEPLGDSLLVVGDSSAVKAHVHTDDPGAALSIGASYGTLEGIEIANMHRQSAEREDRLLRAVPEEPKASEAVAVVAGAGNRRLFESLGARVVEGGQSMNPAAAELVEAIEAASADEVLVLPNNPNVVLTAEQAAELANKPVHVVAARSIQAGLAAMVAFEPSRSAEENAAAMKQILAEVATGAVTVASRDVELNGLAVHKGSYLGLLDGEPIAGGDGFQEVARTVAERLLTEPRDVLTMLTGDEEPPVAELVRELEERHPEVALDVHEGGQPHYPLLLAAE
jgi:DAK2 domain fusion protein YloV